MILAISGTMGIGESVFCILAAKDFVCYTHPVPSSLACDKACAALLCLQLALKSVSLVDLSRLNLVSTR